MKKRNGKIVEIVADRICPVYFLMKEERGCFFCFDEPLVVDLWIIE